MSFKVMNREYLTEQLQIVEQRIRALHNEDKRAMLERSIEISRELSNLEIKQQSLKQRLNSKPATGIKEVSLSNY